MWSPGCSSPFSFVRDELCTGQRAHGYRTGASADQSARLLQSGLVIGCLFVGVFSAAGATNMISARGRAKATASPRRS